MPEPIALIGGTGRSGPALALRFARAGTPVLIGSRDQGRAEERAGEIRGRLAAAGGGAAVTGETNVAAAEAAGLAFVTLPYDAQTGALPSLRSALAGKIVVSTAIPVRFDAVVGPVHVDVPEGSAAHQVADLLAESRIVAGFHSVSNVHLSRLDHELDEDVILTGDDDEAKNGVAAVVRLLPGARAVDGGRLANARYSEQLTVLLLSVNRIVKRSVGIRLTNLPS
jgi:NADPH-dependent F420 reductase